MKKKLLLLFKSLHPIHSRQLSERLLGQTFSFYATFVFIGLIVMLGIFIGLNWNKSFDISDISTNDSVILVDRPMVTLDQQFNETRSFLSFSNQEVTFNKFIFFGKTTQTYTNELTLLLLPGIVLLIGVISVVLSMVLALLSSFIAYVLSRKRKQKITFRDLLVINFHYQAPVLMIFFILYPFWNWAFLILILYLFNYIFGVVLLSNKKFKTLDL